MAFLASYSTRQEGDATVFDVTPAKCPTWWFVFFLSVFTTIGAIGISANVNLGSGLGGLLAIMLWVPPILGFLAFRRDPRPKNTRAPTTLRVSPSQVVGVSSTSYPTEQIKRLFIDNSYGTAAGLAKKRHDMVRAVSWYVAYELLDGRAFNIGRGLDKETAVRLANEVAAILQKEVEFN